MICRIRGILKEKRQNSVIVDVNGVYYEIFAPYITMNALNERYKEEEKIELITYHYFQMDTMKGMPVLFGFFSEIEKEFFEKFITVSGIGPKAAMKALRLPIPVIAKAIDEGDLNLLKSLPGVGEQRAREISAKLQGKVGKFGLIQDKAGGEAPKIQEDIQEEALQVLLQLQYKKAEAKDMINEAVKKHSDIKTSEELLNEIYKQRRA